MILNYSIHSSKYKIASVFLAFFILLLTYKSFEPDLATGLDSSYVWALNYLFQYDLNFMDKLVYPIGPLGFLLMPAPIGNNLYYATLFKVLLQLVFIFQILNYKRATNQWWLNGLIALMASWFATLDVLMIGISFFILLSENKIALKYKFTIIAGFSFLALLIKSSIGIAIHGMVLFYLLYQLFASKKRKEAISASILYLATYVFCNLVYFSDFAEAFHFNRNALRLASSYGDALVLFPEHNAVFIWASLVITYFSLFYKNNNIKTAILLVFPIFTMWKHSMVREDFIHARLFLTFLPFVFGILVLHTNKKYFIGMCWLLASLLYYQNLKSYKYFKPYEFNKLRVNGFFDSVIKLKSFNETNEKLSKDNLKSGLLPDSLLQVIGKETIDVYPYELSYIAANHLNWKPRVTLQSGAFGSWLDRINAHEFDKQDKPTFVLWHLNSDESGSNIATFDNRMVLNDEPITVLTLLRSYNIRMKNKNFILLEKLSETRNITQQLDKPFKFNFDQWIDVKKGSKDLIRLHLNFNPSILSKIRKFVYKGNEYQLDYKLSNGLIISKRFVMDNSKDGLWINPYIFSLDSCIISDDVHQIRVKSRMEETNELIGQYEYLNINTDLFDCQYELKGEELLSASFLLYKNNEHQVAVQGYSKTWIINVDSIWKEGIDSVKVLASCNIRANCSNNANLIMSFENNESVGWYKVSPYDCNVIDKRLFLQKTISKKLLPKGFIKAYVWNTGTEPLELEDMTFNIQSIK